MVTQIKLIGVTIDNLLSFQTHIKGIFRKVNAKVLILRRICKHIPPDIMIKLYKAFILPHFEYASPLFTGLSKGLSAKLELTNAFALKALLNHSNLIAYEELLKTALIKSLEHRRIEQALIFVYKSIYDQAPIYMGEMFVLRDNGYNLRGDLFLFFNSYSLSTIICICRLCKLFPCNFYVTFAFKRAFAHLRYIGK